MEVTTGGGNIDVQDIDGPVRLTSAGGNISVGRVGGGVDQGCGWHWRDREKPTALPFAELRVKSLSYWLAWKLRGADFGGDVAGTLRATTSGGHITAGNIDGDAILHTGGGQIYTGRITGTAALDSGGGNIHVQSAGASVTADTAGGGIVLRQAAAPLRVSASSGGITAWLQNGTGPKTSGSAPNNSADTKLPGASQLFSTDGDIVVYIPRSLAATIDAIVEQGRGHPHCRRSFTPCGNQLPRFRRPGRQ